MDRSSILFCLGPTNTGKTYRAIERMLEHESGMMGLPLRLLAREVFDKVEKRVGAESVALITGEEKRVPAHPRYFICTVEAMPTDRRVDFLAVDEIQLASHAERGHVFTDRILFARGERETWFLGSDTMRGVVEGLVPTAEFRRFPRLSDLTSEGTFSLGALPRRSAVVAFSTRRVYELAEKLRARKGGAAIVHGGLSPRARNAQVGMFQEGEVDYLVATDAIGMGLNLDIDRVAFADVQKFDGHRLRELELAELGQIAGRAGRHTKNGTFATFCRDPLPRDVVRAIEQHRFPQIRRLVWRSRDLDFSSPDALTRTLETRPALHVLELVADPEDTRTLRKVLFYPEVRGRVSTEESLRLLWEVCQTPDYRNLLVDEHARLVAEIFAKIVDAGRLPAEFVHKRLDHLARHSGDIDTITARISFTRTWNYVANQPRWVERAPELQERTRRLEDTLSDALHQALLDRFVARRRRTVHTVVDSTTASFQRRDGSFSGQLLARHGQLLRRAPSTPPLEEALRAGDHEIELILEGQILWQQTVLGNLRAGRTVLEPDLAVIDPTDKGGLRAALIQRLRAWLRQEVERALGPLARDGLEEGSSAVRGILYQLRQSFGALPARNARTLVAALRHDDMQSLLGLGVHLGKHFIYVKELLEPSSIRRRAPLVRAFVLSHRRGSRPMVTNMPSPLASADFEGAPTFPAAALDAESCLMLGYVRYGSIALRVDLAEELAQASRLPGRQFREKVREVSQLPVSEAVDLSARLAGKRRRGRRSQRSPKAPRGGSNDGSSR